MSNPEQTPPKISLTKKLQHVVRSPWTSIPCCLGRKDRIALNTAAHLNDIKKVKQLLECGANPNYVSSKTRERASVSDIVVGKVCAAQGN
jgi:hypothetical protein